MSARRAARGSPSLTRSVAGRGQQPGIGVDAAGGGVIDPTKNVEDLVRALEIALAEFRKSDIKYVDTQLVAAEKLQNYARDAEARLHKLELGAETRLRDSLRSADAALSSAETRRIDQLAQTRQEFQNTIRDMLAESVRTTSTLVSTQLVQIQATFDTRVSKLEAGAFTQAGKQSERDPQITDALVSMRMGLSTLRSDTESIVAKLAQANIDAVNKISNVNAEAIAKLTAAIAGLKETSGEVRGKGMGRGEVFAWLSAAVIAGGVVVTIFLRAFHGPLP